MSHRHRTVERMFATDEGRRMRHSQKHRATVCSHHGVRVHLLRAWAGVMTVTLSTNVDPNTHQGFFAETFVASIAAAAGFDVSLPRVGKGIDLQVFTTGFNGTSGSRQITLQVKSWSTGKLSDDGCFHYPLSVSAYNYLCGDVHDTRHYLVLCVVPPSDADFAAASDQALTLRQAAYWLSLRDEQADETLNNDSTKTVLVPRTHLLTADTIRALVANQEAAAVVA